MCLPLAPNTAQGWLGMRITPPEDHDLAPSASPSRRQGGSGLEGGAEGKGEGMGGAEPLGPCTAASRALNHK